MTGASLIARRRSQSAQRRSSRHDLEQLRGASRGSGRLAELGYLSLDRSGTAGSPRRVRACPATPGRLRDHGLRDTPQS